MDTFPTRKPLRSSSSSSSNNSSSDSEETAVRNPECKCNCHDPYFLEATETEEHEDCGECREVVRDERGWFAESEAWLDGFLW